MTVDPIILVREIIPTLVLLCIVVGSSLLWRRTKRASALIQLVTSAVLLLEALLTSIRSCSLSTPCHSSWMSRALWAQSLTDTMIPITLVCVVIFAGAYLWYALGAKRI